MLHLFQPTNTPFIKNERAGRVGKENHMDRESDPNSTKVVKTDQNTQISKPHVSWTDTQLRRNTEQDCDFD